VELFSQIILILKSNEFDNEPDNFRNTV